MLNRETIVIAVFTLFFSLSMLFVAFSSDQQSIMRQDINQDGVVNNLDYLKMFSLAKEDESLKSKFFDVYSRSVYDPTGDGVWDEKDKKMMIDAFGDKEGETRYDPRADLFPDGRINQIDLEMAGVAEKSQGQILGNPLSCMYGLVRRIGWQNRLVERQ